MDAWLLHLLAVSPFFPSSMGTTGFSTESQQHNHHYGATERHKSSNKATSRASPPISHHISSTKEKKRFLTKEWQKNKLEYNYHHCLWGVQLVFTVFLLLFWVFTLKSLKRIRRYVLCRYMFIGAVCPTTVEMDLMFVLVVRFILLNCNRSYYLVHVWPLPLLCLQKANERAEILDDMNV